MKLKIAVLIVVMATSTSYAAAADMPQVAQPYGSPISPAYNWTGFYLGLMGGYGQSTSEAINGFALTNAHLKGGFVGSTLGFNYQIGQFVIGIEDEGAWSGISKTWPIGFGLLQDQILAFGSVTGRAGFAVDNVLIYGKGGYAWMINELSAAGPGGSAWERRYHPGWTVGAGLEWAFAGTWSAKLEYMFAEYLGTSYVDLNNASISADVQTVKVGINYRFGWAGQPVTARY